MSISLADILLEMSIHGNAIFENVDIKPFLWLDSTRNAHKNGGGMVYPPPERQAQGAFAFPWILEIIAEV